MRSLTPLLLLLLASCSASTPVELSDQEKSLLADFPGTPGTEAGLVEQGDVLFVKAIGDNRRGEVADALQHYSHARSLYLEAQSHYQGLGAVPQPLLDRVKECVTRIAALQRQRHAAPQ